MNNESPAVYVQVQATAILRYVTHSHSFDNVDIGVTQVLLSLFVQLRNPGIRDIPLNI